MATVKKARNKFTYQENLPEDYSEFRKLLETYSKIPPEEVEDHIYKIVRALSKEDALAPRARSNSVTAR